MTVADRTAEDPGLVGSGLDGWRPREREVSTTDRGGRSLRVGFLLRSSSRVGLCGGVMGAMDVTP